MDPQNIRPERTTTDPPHMRHWVLPQTESTNLYDSDQSVQQQIHHI
jgi:hypothetical protein